MSPNEKGFFPTWVDDEDIISQILSKMLSEGTVPYSYVINPEHDPITRERMKKILARMEQEKLILLPAQEFDFIEFGINGSGAAIMGYMDYKWRQKRGSHSNKISVLFFRLILIGACAGILYLVLHSFKVI